MTMGAAPQEPPCPFVSRAGVKLRHALDAFALDVRGWEAADFGCNAGGFTDCLLQAGAARVRAIDTGYGALAWKLRQDPRVVVMERTNALHAPPPPEGVDLVVVDLAWTRQHHAVPAALRWLRAAPGSRIITLVKPHYEVEPRERGRLVDGFLPHEDAPAVVARVSAAMAGLGAAVLGETLSPITGGKSARRRGAAGNLEYLLLLARAGEIRG